MAPHEADGRPPCRGKGESIARDQSDTQGVIMTTPRGLRAEGLDLDALCIDLAKLG
jgi:hypothetical protein